MALLLLGLALGVLLAWGWAQPWSRRRRRHNPALRMRVRALQQRARDDERQRLLRDLHDGLGAQLAGMLHLVEAPRWPRALLAAQVQHAVDELRLAFDALQPEGDALDAVMAQLRHRLVPRLAAAGLIVEWPVTPLPPIALGADAALDLQRLLLEAFTNVLKHAQARTVRVETPVRAGDLEICVQDDGVGLGVRDSAQGNGLGLASMQARALRLGGSLVLEPVTPHGLCVCLRVPLERLPEPAG